MAKLKVQTHGGRCEAVLVKWNGLHGQLHICVLLKPHVTVGIESQRHAIAGSAVAGGALLLGRGCAIMAIS